MLSYGVNVYQNFSALDLELCSVVEHSSNQHQTWDWRQALQKNYHVTYAFVWTQLWINVHHTHFQIYMFLSHKFLDLFFLSLPFFFFWQDLSLSSNLSLFCNSICRLDLNLGSSPHFALWSARIIEMGHYVKQEPRLFGECMYVYVCMYVHLCVERNMCICVHVEVRGWYWCLSLPHSTLCTEAGSLIWTQSSPIWLV